MNQQYKYLKKKIAYSYQKATEFVSKTQILSYFEARGQMSFSMKKINYLPVKCFGSAMFHF